jgi:Tubulin-tyrosine ligase family
MISRRSTTNKEGKATVLSQPVSKATSVASTKRGTRATVGTTQRLILRLVGIAALGLLLVASKSRFSIRNDGPPSSLVVTGRRPSYTKVPDAFRRTFYFADGVKFRGPVGRAFRNRGWRKTDVKEEAHVIWDHTQQHNFDTLLPWQRYNYFPGFKHWDSKEGFIKGFDRYAKANPDRDLYMIPETYRLATLHGREEFHKRLFEEGGLGQPWVLKDPDAANGRGITMLGPNSNELKHVLKDIKSEEDVRYIVQAYICNELTWWGNRKFDLRFYWLVASLDPLIVLFHDGMVRVGNAKYDETDFSSTTNHLTTMTYLAEEAKGTVDELQDLVRHHYRKNYKTLKHIKVDPYTHIYNQFKASIAETVAAFSDVTFGNNKNQPMSAENAFGFYGVDFVIDNDLDVWYLESQKGPGMEEDHDFRVEMYRDLLRSAIDIVEEIQIKLEVDPKANVLPIRNLMNWDIVYIEGAGGVPGGDDERWMYEYKGYKRSKKKKGCRLPGTNKAAHIPATTQRVRKLTSE